jgi:hypothetical protein
MTNVLASNAIVPQRSDVRYFLPATKEGSPLNRQVPRTYQDYTGTGGTITYDGSSEININGTTLITPLIIRLGPTISELRNWLGRQVTINIKPGNLVTITLISSPALMCINGTALVQGSHVVPSDGLSKSISIYFNSLSRISMDYGACASNVLPTALPQISFQRFTYAYGRVTFFNVPSVYIPNNATYDVIWSGNNRETEGYFTPGTETTSITGPGNQFLGAAFICASQRTESTNFSGYLTQAGVYFGSFTIQASPILSGVFDAPWFTGVNPDGTLKSLNLDETNVDLIAVTVEGDKVQLGPDLNSLAVCVADCICFFVRTTNDTEIRYTSFINFQDDLILIDVSTIGPALWTPGARIADIEYDEKDKCLYVLPNQNFGLLLRIGIMPMDEVNRPFQYVRTTTYTSRQLSIAGAVLPHSIAVCPQTSSLLVGHSRAVGNLGIAVFQNYGSMAFSYLYTHPSISTQKVIVGFTANGNLVIHYERDLSVHTQDYPNHRPLTTILGDVVPVFTLSSFCPSLSRTCYGWTQT